MQITVRQLVKWLIMFVLFATCILSFAGALKWYNGYIILAGAVSWAGFLLASGFLNTGVEISSLSTSPVDTRRDIAKTIDAAELSIKNVGDIVSPKVLSGEAVDCDEMVYSGEMVEKIREKAAAGLETEILTGPIPEGTSDQLIAQQSKEDFKRLLENCVTKGYVAEEFINLLKESKVTLYKACTRPKYHFTVIDDGRIVVVEKPHKYGRTAPHRRIVNPLLLGDKYRRKFESLKKNAERISFDVDIV